MFIYSNMLVIGAQVLLILFESLLDDQQQRWAFLKKEAAKVSASPVHGSYSGLLLNVAVVCLLLQVERRHVGVNTIPSSSSTESDPTRPPTPPPYEDGDPTWNRRDNKWKRIRALQMGLVRAEDWEMPERFLQTS